VANPDCLPEERDEWKPQSPDGFDFFGGDFVHYAREVTEASFQLRGLLFRMNADLAIRQEAVERSKHKEFDEFLYGEEEDVQDKLLRAIQASTACGAVQADDSAAQTSLIAWRTAAWTGVIRFPAELARYSLLDSFTKSWDLAMRVCELRSKIARGVAAGRYGGAV
jgi:hypothetical protein